MSKLRVVTFAILLLLVVAVGCSSSDQGAKEHGGSSIERVNIEAKDDYGVTPLHNAAQRNSPDIARELIDLGADVEAKDDYGVTPLHMAVSLNSLDVARLLIDSGANTDGIDLSWMN